MSVTKVFFAGTTSTSLANLYSCIKNLGPPLKLGGYYNVTSPMINTPTEFLFTKEQHEQLRHSSAIITWGTWGSKHQLRFWDENGAINKHGYKDQIATYAHRMANQLQIPHLVSETGTLSRLRTNYVDVPSFKHLSKYYRLGLHHWTWGRTIWSSPSVTQYCKLEKFVQTFYDQYKIEYHPEKHKWENNTSPNGEIWLFPGLEHDPTSTYPPDVWAKKVVDYLIDITNRTIVIKKHPLSEIDFSSMFEKNKQVKVYKSSAPVKYLKRRMYCGVVDSSTTIFELVDMGIPVFCTNYSFAAPLGNTNISNINNIYYAPESVYLNWANTMSYTEFSHYEHAEADMLLYVQHLIDKGKKQINEVSTRKQFLGL